MTKFRFGQPAGRVKAFPVERGDVPHQAEETITLPAEPASAAAARSFVRRSLAQSGHGSVTDAAMLCVTELVANVSRHTGARHCVVTVRDAPHSVVIEVGDTDVDELPSVEPWSAEAEHGRGLRIVNALAREWGVRRRPERGKFVWLELCDAQPD